MTDRRLISFCVDRIQKILLDDKAQSAEWYQSVEELPNELCDMLVQVLVNPRIAPRDSNPRTHEAKSWPHGNQKDRFFQVPPDQHYELVEQVLRKRRLNRFRISHLYVYGEYPEHLRSDVFFAGSLTSLYIWSKDLENIAMFSTPLRNVERLWLNSIYREEIMDIVDHMFPRLGELHVEAFSVFPILRLPQCSNLVASLGSLSLRLNMATMFGGPPRVDARSLRIKVLWINAGKSGRNIVEAILGMIDIDAVRDLTCEYADEFGVLDPAQFRNCSRFCCRNMLDTSMIQRFIDRREDDAVPITDFHEISEEPTNLKVVTEFLRRFGQSLRYISLLIHARNAGQLLPFLPRVKSMILLCEHPDNSLTDVTAKCISRHCPKLKQLTVYWNPRQIWGELGDASAGPIFGKETAFKFRFVSELFRVCSGLRQLTLSCRNYNASETLRRNKDNPSEIHVCCGGGRVKIFDGQ